MKIEQNGTPMEEDISISQEVVEQLMKAGTMEEYLAYTFSHCSPGHFNDED